MPLHFLTDNEVRLLQKLLDEHSGGVGSRVSTDFAAGPQNTIREFQLTEELGPNSTAGADLVVYIGDGSTCDSNDFTVDSSRSFKVGGGAMSAFRLKTFAEGTRGQCWKSPKRDFWTILQVDCEAEGVL